MSKNDAEVRLPTAAEDLLSAWPHPQRDDAEWEKSAQAVMSRLPDATADASLFEPPLPATDEERPSQPEAPKKSLLEMARMVEAESAPKDDNDIARESLSFALRERTSSPSFHDIRQSSPAPISATQTPVSAVPAPLPANVTRLERRSNAGPIGMVVVALAGLAAATFIVMQTRNASQSSVAVAPPTPAVGASAAPPAATTKIDESEVVALGDLGADKPGSRNGKGTNQGGAAATLDKPKPGEAPATEKPTAKKNEPGEPEDSKMRPAESKGATPEKPALGAVQAAVGAVLGSARACVAGQDDASSATIVFGSDGKVQSVAVSGPAAGTNAEPCIKAALSKARVQPFSRPTFAASAAIRP